MPRKSNSGACQILGVDLDLFKHDNLQDKLSDIAAYLHFEWGRELREWRKKDNVARLVDKYFTVRRSEYFALDESGKPLSYKMTYSSKQR